MKKPLPLFIVFIMIAAFTLCVNASESAKESIYEAALRACPEAYRDQYLPTLQSTLDQITVTAEQADEIIMLIDDAKNTITETIETQNNVTTEEQVTDTSSTEEYTTEVSNNTTQDIIDDSLVKDQIIDIIDNSTVGEQIKEIISEASTSEVPASANDNTNVSSESKQQQLIGIVNDACAILGLTAKVDANSIATESMSAIKVDVYHEGKKIAAINNTPVKLTGGSQTTGISGIIVAVLLMIIGFSGAVALAKHESEV